MKKRLSLVTFTIAIVFIIIGIWTYRTYIKAKMDNISVQTVEIECHNNPQFIVLKKHPDQKDVFQLEFSVEGSSTKNLNIQIGPSEHQMISDMRIKKGKIETAYINDWYYDSAFVKIDSDKNAKGKLSISYQFIGTDSE